MVKHGSNRNDTISGTSATDILYGNSGNDKLSGGSMRDWLFGGNGNDTLIGGGGVDDLTGGEGNDVFVFTTIGGAGKGGKTVTDNIRDFDMHGDNDRVDLSGIDADTSVKGNQAFHWASGVVQKGGLLSPDGPGLTGKAGELTLERGSGRMSVDVVGDVNGDGIADFRISVHSGKSLYAHDFDL